MFRETCSRNLRYFVSGASLPKHHGLFGGGRSLPLPSLHLNWVFKVVSGHPCPETALCSHLLNGGFGTGCPEQPDPTSPRLRRTGPPLRCAIDYFTPATGSLLSFSDGSTVSWKNSSTRSGVMPPWIISPTWTFGLLLHFSKQKVALKSS